MMGVRISERNKQYVLGLIIALSGVLLLLCAPQMVKADDVGVENSSDLQGMLNENSAVVQNAPSTESTPVNTIAPLSATITESGTFGTCDWDIDDTGLLTIHAGVLGSSVTNKDVPWYVYAQQIKNIYIDPGVTANNNSAYLFGYLTNVVSIDVSNLDTSSTVNMSYMFFDEPNLSELKGIGNWDTSLVTNMGYMFSNGITLKTSLTSLDGIEKWNTSNVTSMENMFASESKITKLDVSGWDVSNVTSLTGTFSSCSSVDIVGLQNWNTGKVQGMSKLFLGNKGSNASGTENWDVSNVTNMSTMFAQMKGLTELDISKWDRSKVTDISSMFSLDSQLTEIKGLDNWNTENVINMSMAFNGTRFTSMPEVEKWNVQNATNLSGVFYNCTKLEHLDLSGWNTVKATNMSSLLGGDSQLNEKTFTGLDTLNTSNVTNMSAMFSGTGFTVLDLTNFDTKKVQNLSSTFSRTKNLIQIKGTFDTSSLTLVSGIFDESNITDFSGLNIGDWDTSKVTDFNTAFRSNQSTNLDFLKNWKVNSGTNFSDMFKSCPNLTTLPVSSWSMPKASNLSGMLGSDPKLETLDTSNWAPQKLTNLLETFRGDSSLKYVDVSNWNTSAVTTMNSTFDSCYALENLDVSNWNTDKVTDMTDLFNYDRKLSGIDLSNWNTTKADTTAMFNGMSNLWEITLGENSVIKEESNFPTHNPGISIYDSSTPTQYKSVSERWQALAPEKGGTPHAPAGELYTQDDILNLYGTTGSAAQTYVWQQQPYMDVSMDVPDLSYGTAMPDQGITPREQSNWAITLNNNVYPVTTLNTTISVNMEKPLANSVGDTLDDSFIFRDNSGNDSVISTTPTTIYDGKLANGTKSLSWDSNHGFLMNLHSYQTPMGNYTTTLDWTMVNSV